MKRLKPSGADADIATMARQRSLGDHAGFTLVEVIVAATILLVGVLGVLTLLNAANRATSRTKAREAATNLAREVIEAARAVAYPNLTPPQIAQELQGQPGLASTTSPAVWTVKRRNTTYTLTASVCSVDDGQDGYGDHTGGYFCSNSTGTGTTDSNPDDYKRAAITATWHDGAGTRSVRQEAVINNPGSAFAPAVKSLISDKGINITTPAAPSAVTVTFTATTNIRAQDLRWSVDGVDQSTAATPVGTAGTQWTFQWNITSISDGTYVVGAQAFDRYGQAGKQYLLTVVINRAAPTPPTGFLAGANPLWGPSAVEFEWSPNPERDIVEYRVYRTDGATRTLACSKSIDAGLPTSCMEASTPAPPAGGQWRYYVVSVAPSRTTPGQTEESTPPPSGQALVANTRPTAPASVSVSTGSDGVTLSWPAASDPDGTIRYYRIYRDDNSSIDVRYDRTASGSQLSYTDPAGLAGSHRYWVTAVDDRLAESPFAPAGGITP